MGLFWVVPLIDTTILQILFQTAQPGLLDPLVQWFNELVVGVEHLVELLVVIAIIAIVLKFTLGRKQEGSRDYVAPRVWKPWQKG